MVQYRPAPAVSLGGWEAAGDGEAAARRLHHEQSLLAAMAASIGFGLPLCGVRGAPILCSVRRIFPADGLLLWRLLCIALRI